MQGYARVSEINYGVRLLAVLALLGTIVACDSKQNEFAEPPPPKVTVAQPVQQEVIEYLDFTGNTRAVEEVEIRARVSGFLQSMHFTPGTRVDLKDELFVIDPKEYQAEYNAAKAELTAARAQHHRAEIEYERAKRVFDQGAGRETDVVTWQGERDVALAAIERAKAKLERAQLNLNYTRITAPISGRVSRNYVDIGNLVGEGEATLLTTIKRYDPMYVYFNLNENDLLRVMAMYRERITQKGINPDTDPDSKAEIELFMGLANEEGFPHEGIVDFAESGVDPGTGTLQVRGVFPNSETVKVLIPGLFARLRLPIGKVANALLVTDRAIGADQGGNYLLVVGSDNAVEKRSIRMGQLVDGLRVIGEGLQPGELVIVKGLQRARPGAKVDPEKIDMKTLTASAIKAAAEAKLDKAKAAAAAPEGDGAKSGEKEEKKKDE
jgi:RND family efflux transporter MFP subunit